MRAPGAGLPLAGGHRFLFPRLRPLDVEFMKALHQRVNIVPILAKADTLTPLEVERKKRKVREAGGGGGEQVGFWKGWGPQNCGPLVCLPDPGGDRALWNQGLPVPRL